jgi:hypothetical protein
MENVDAGHGPEASALMQDTWLLKPAKRRTPAEVKRDFRALRVPRQVSTTLLDRWRASPAAVEPVLQLVKKLVVAHAMHRAQVKGARWAAGYARDPHHKETPETPGALSPIRDIVEQLIADLERLIDWKFTPPIAWEELDAKHKRTGRTVRLASLDENIRGAFTTARRALLVVRARLREDTRRSRGRPRTLVHPFQGSAVRQRELVAVLRDQLLTLHPARKQHARTARIEAAHLAREIIAAVLPRP